jgi:uncharacterized damage-inducible protein DinB
MLKKEKTQTQTKTKEEIIGQYAAGSEQLDTALEGLSESDLDLSRAQGKWTIRQIVHHIADAEDLWETGIKAALGNSGCAFDFNWYIPDNKCAEPLDYANRPITDAVELFKAIRSHVVQMINHLPNAWERYIIFTHGDLVKEKKITVGELIEWQVRHLLLHIEQIRDTRKVHGK